MEAAVRVDAALRTGVGSCALVYIHTRLPIPLKLETWMTPALKGPKAQGDMSQSHSLRVLVLHSFSLDKLQGPATAYYKTSVFHSTLSLIFAQFICKAVLKPQH